jgi:hypothetical protein
MQPMLGPLVHIDVYDQESPRDNEPCLSQAVTLPRAYI